MLNRALVLTAAVLAFAPAAEAQSPQSGAIRTAAIMSDSLPYGNRFGLPFTREEYERALLQVRSEEDAEFFARIIFEPDEEASGIAFADADLLALAALTSDLAARIVEYKPRLRERVQVVQADPQAFVRLMRSFRTVEPPGPGTSPVREHGFADMDLLLLAALFPDQADRIVEIDPGLRERVREVQADPQAFARRLRSSREAEPPGPGTDPTQGH